MRALILFLIALYFISCVWSVPIPGDCNPRPYFRDKKTMDRLKKSLHLDCTLTAINSDFEKTNFSVIPSEQTISLKVTCLNKMSNSYLNPQGKTHLLIRMYFSFNKHDIYIRYAQINQSPDQINALMIVLLCH